VCREGSDAERCNRFQRGRTRDEASTYGGDRFFQERALAVCAQDGLDRRFKHLDTTSFSRRGAYGPDSDEHAMTMTHGYATDHRPDLKQAVVELMGSQDGGVPFVRQSGDGHTADSQIFQARAQALRHAFTNPPSPRYLVAEATLDHEDHASSLHSIGFITRMPNTLGVVAQVIVQALGWDTWQPCDDNTRSPPLALGHDGMAQRWLVGYAPAARARAAATLPTAKPREHQAITTPLLHVQATRIGAPRAAQEALAALATPWTDPRVESSHLSAHHHDAGNGRPTPRTPLQAIEWHIQAQVRSDDATIEHAKQVQACGGLGTHLDASDLSPAEVMAADTGQAPVDGSLRCRKDPRCVVSAVLVKQPHRIDGLRMVLTRALLVDSVAQRRRRTP
jgi:transposase